MTSRRRLVRKSSLTRLVPATITLLSMIGALRPLPVRAQSSPPKFEVASIRRCSSDFGPNDRGGREDFSPGRVTINCLSVSGLIQYAYVVYANGIRANPGLVANTPIEGGPGWIDSEAYKITATAEGGAIQAVMEGPMLQNLLEDRFHLKIRRATRNLPIYELTIAKGGTKLKPFVEGSCIPAKPAERVNPAPQGQHYCNAAPSARGPNMVVDLEGITMEEYARSLSGNPVVGIDRPVVDKTGLTGKFTLHIEFAPPANLLERMRQNGQDVGDPTAPALAEALQEQLGLQLKSVNGNREYFVVEHIERPGEN